jgi:hypothetical protein
MLHVQQYAILTIGIKITGHIVSKMHTIFDNYISLTTILIYPAYFIIWIIHNYKMIEYHNSGSMTVSFAALLC